MRQWIETLVHRLKGHITVSVMPIFDANLEPFSMWALDTFSEDGHICVDGIDGKVYKWPLTQFEFTVSQ